VAGPTLASARYQGDIDQAARASQIGHVGVHPHQDRHDRTDDAGVVGEYGRGPRHAEAETLPVYVLRKRNPRRECVGASDRAHARQRSRDGNLALSHATRDIEDRRMVDTAGIIVEDELDSSAQLDRLEAVRRLRRFPNPWQAWN
jgi:hypothetical protein